MRFVMKAKFLTAQRLPILFATGMLSIGLLLSACSSSDSDDKNSAESAMDTENSTDEAAANAQETEANEPLTAAEAEDILENETNYFLLTVDFDYHGGDRDGEIYYRKLVIGNDLDEKIKWTLTRTE